MKSTTKREVLTGVITFLVYGILGFAAYLLTALPEAGLDSLAAVLVGGIAFGIVFGRKRSNGYLIGLIASVVFFLGAGLGFIVSMISLFTYGSDGKMSDASIPIIIAYAAVPYIAYAAARIKASKRNKIKTA